jgi:hypothetical protein
MINDLDRLLTIADLSELLGVPVDTLCGCRHRGALPRCHGEASQLDQD